MELVGYTLEQMASDLPVIENAIAYGEVCEIKICTEQMPTPELLDQIYTDIVLSGHHATRLNTRIDGEVVVTSFRLLKGSPQWTLLIPVIAPLATLGLIAYGITRAESLVNFVVPVLLISGCIVIAAIALARRPVEKYIERGGRLPLLPDARGRRTEDAEELIKRLRAEAKSLWAKACQWEGIPTDSKFVVFDPKNPYDKQYNAKMLELQKYTRLIQAGGGLRHIAKEPKYLSRSLLPSTIPKVLTAS